jgi:hypothetical protein
MGFLRRRSDEPEGERFLMDIPLILAIAVAIDSLTTRD